MKPKRIWTGDQIATRLDEIWAQYQKEGAKKNPSVKRLDAKIAEFSRWCSKKFIEVE